MKVLFVVPEIRLDMAPQHVPFWAGILSIFITVGLTKELCHSILREDSSVWEGNPQLFVYLHLRDFFFATFHPARFYDSEVTAHNTILLGKIQEGKAYTKKQLLCSSIFELFK